MQNKGWKKKDTREMKNINRMRWNIERITSVEKIEFSALWKGAE